MTLASLELPSFRPQHLQVRQNLLLLEVPVPPLETAPAGTALCVQREPCNSLTALLPSALSFCEPFSLFLIGSSVFNCLHPWKCYEDEVSVLFS